MGIALEALCAQVADLGWEQGVNSFLDHCSASEHIELCRLVRNRLTNLKLFIDLALEKVLVVDDQFGLSADALCPHFKVVLHCCRSWYNAKITTIRNAGQVRGVTVHDYSKLPFAPQTFDAVVFVGKGIGTDDRGGSGMEQTTLEELYRVMKPGAWLLIMSATGSGGPRRFLLRPAGQNSQGKRRCRPRRWFLGPPCVKESYEAIPDQGWWHLENTAHTFVARLRFRAVNQLLYPLFVQSHFLVVPGEDCQSSTLEKMVAEVAQATESRYRLEKALFLSSTLIFLKNEEQQGQSLVVRASYEHSESRLRCQKNYTALESLQYMWPDLPFRVPAAVYQGCVDRVHFFVEGRLPGVGIDSPCRSYNRLVLQAALLAATIYQQTRRPIKLCQGEFAAWLSNTSYLLDSPLLAHRQSDIERVKEMLGALENDSTLEVCLCHGDFKVENILVGRDGFFSGLIDWDLHAMAGSPCLDIFHLLCRRRAVYTGSTMLQFIHALLLEELDAFERTILHRYIDESGVSSYWLKHFGLIYWLHAVTCRIGYPMLKNNRRWLKEHIEEPLDAFLSTTTNRVTSGAR